jgi:type VI secretion system protein ImpL
MLVVIVLLVLGTSVFLYVVLRRARKISFSPGPHAKPESDKSKAAPIEFLQHASNVDLRASFRHALRILKTHVTGRDFRYQVPWFLMAGEADSGKTTLLESAGLNLSVSEAFHGDQQLNWYFFDDGLVIDAAGDFVLRGNGTANHRGWNTISRLLQKHRPQRPLDGIVLTIPASDLIGSNELEHERSRRLEEKATCLYEKLWQAQKILGMCLPVYVLITKCDEVTGFGSFSNQLPEKLQSQMLGWSNSCSLETAYSPSLVPEAFESLHHHITRLQFEIYTERDEIQNADELFLFPSAMQSMRQSLQIYLDCLFKQSAYHESYFFRGIYFCGESNLESSMELASQTVSEQGWADQFEPFEASLPQEMPVQTRKPLFLSGLFKEKILSEAALAQPIRRTALSRNRVVLTAQALSLLILILGFGGIAATYPALARREAALYEFLVDEKTDLEIFENSYGKSSRQPADNSYRMATYRGTANAKLAALQSADLAYEQGTRAADTEWTSFGRQALQNGESRLLLGMAKTNGNSFYGVFLPSSWFSGIDDRLEHSIAIAFKYIIFESLRSELERRGKALLDNAADYSPTLNANSSYRQSDPPSGYDFVNQPELDRNFQLHRYVEDLGELRVNLDRYDRLIRKDYSSSEDLRQLVKYLGHAPLPDGFDTQSELFKRGMNSARGTPIETQQYYKEAAIRAAEIVEDMYERSFHRGVKYDYLNDIAESEALLNRSEYTWLSSFVFDPHSPFHGQSLSSALRQLQQALQDLRRQRFMARGPEDGVVPRVDTPRYQHVMRRVLVWDQETLQQTLVLYEQYQNFVESKSYEPSEDLDNSVKQAARTRVKARMSRLISQARRYQSLAPAVQGSVLRASLTEEVRQLQETQDLLSQVLQISTRLGIDREIRGALSSQAAYLLRGIQREFVSQRFYVAKQPDFAWWDGRQPVSYLVYDLGSPEDLAIYLAMQRKGIAFLGRDLAVPVMTFFASQNIYVPRDNGLVDWDEILTDLDAFDNKSPGNPIGALENFIRVDMDRTSIDSCNAVWISEASSTNYFLRIRNALRVEFYARCTELAHVKAINDSLAELQNYREIEESFNQNLAGGFPFSYLDDQTRFPDLDPWAMIKFFKVLDSREKAARDALNRSALFGASPGRATEFLDQVDKVKEFFAPFLEKKQGPVFDFRVQFRVNRDQEIAANQIIDWKLEVGKKKFAYLSDDLTGQWIFGDPIRLSLRWANDSPRVPVSGATPVPVTVKERTAVFEYKDRWSLFTFLLRHGLLLKRAGATPDCDQGFDADPYTLKFTIKTQPDPALTTLQPRDLKQSDAEVFARISLVTANKQEPLMLPCFPTKAPSVPSLFLNPRYKDD